LPESFACMAARFRRSDARTMSIQSQHQGRLEEGKGPPRCQAPKTPFSRDLAENVWCLASLQVTAVKRGAIRRLLVRLSRKWAFS
jgi:hypothetical protein